MRRQLTNLCAMGMLLLLALYHPQQGGCHAVLMELVGQTLVQGAILESIQIDFVAAARGSVRIVAAPLVPENLLQMRVCIYDVAKNNRLVSDGKLMWSSLQQQQQQQKARL